MTMDIRDMLMEWHHATDLAVAKDAVDEIERLQTAKRRALKIADERSYENVGLRAENERLREALKPFADAWIYRREPSGYTFVDGDFARAAGALGVAEQNAPTEESNKVAQKS